MLPHAPIPSNITSDTMPRMMRDLWSPAFQFAEMAIQQLFESFDYEVLVRSTIERVKPHGIDSTLSLMEELVHFSQYRYDPREDRQFE